MGRAKFRHWWASGALGRCTTWVNDRGEAFLVVRLLYLLPLMHHSRHPVACAFAYWDSHVSVALLEHGCYAPERQHQPLPGEELDAIEVQSALRDAYEEFWGKRWEETWERTVIQREGS